MELETTQEAPPSSAHSLMLGSLTAYFQKNAANRRMLHDLIEGRTAISLRLLDWFVTHFAKKNNVLYWLDPKGDFHMSLPTKAQSQHTHEGSRKFTVYTEYRAQLRAFSKHAFDPFRRHNRISFVVNERPDGSPIFVDTTIGQLNFFRWALQNKVIEYVLRNLHVIEDDMASFQQHRRITPAASVAASTTAPGVATIIATPPTTIKQANVRASAPQRAATRLLPTRMHFD